LKWPQLYWIWSDCGENAVKSIETEKGSKIYSFSLIFALLIRDYLVKYAAYGLKRRVAVTE